MRLFWRKSVEQSLPQSNWPTTEQVQAQRIRDLGGTPTGDLVYDIMLEPTLLFPRTEDTDGQI